MIRAEYSSGDLARATGNTVRTIRFYEEQGLLRPAEVSEGGHRRYTAEELEKLRLIADLRELGLPLAEIRAVLDLRAGCNTAAEFATRFEEALVVHLAQAERRLERLRRVKRELFEALTAIRSRLTCEAPDRCPCAVSERLGSARIVKVLARAGLCTHSHGTNGHAAPMGDGLAPANGRAETGADGPTAGSSDTAADVGPHRDPGEGDPL